MNIKSRWNSRIIKNCKSYKKPVSQIPKQVTYRNRQKSWEKKQKTHLNKLDTVRSKKECKPSPAKKKWTTKEEMEKSKNKGKPNKTLITIKMHNKQNKTTKQNTIGKSKKKKGTTKRKVINLIDADDNGNRNNNNNSNDITTMSKIKVENKDPKSMDRINLVDDDDDVAVVSNIKVEDNEPEPISGIGPVSKQNIKRKDKQKNQERVDNQMCKDKDVEMKMNNNNNENEINDNDIDMDGNDNSGIKIEKREMSSSDILIGNKTTCDGQEHKLYVSPTDYTISIDSRSKDILLVANKNNMLDYGKGLPIIKKTYPIMESDNNNEDMVKSVMKDAEIEIEQIGSMNRILLEDEMKVIENCFKKVFAKNVIEVLMQAKDPTKIKYASNIAKMIKAIKKMWIIRFMV